MIFVDLPEGLHRPGNATMLSFAPQRSGQHLVIDWICRGLGQAVAHLNHCRLVLGPRGLRLMPVRGRARVYTNGESVDSRQIGKSALAGFLEPMRYTREFYTMEDVVPDDAGYAGLCARYGDPTIIILRDPANWLASTFAHRIRWPRELKIWRKVRMMRRLLKYVLSDSARARHVVINFNEFVTDSDYRSSVANQIGLSSLDLAEGALGEVQNFGGGSSFERRIEAPGARVVERWRNFEQDAFYRALLGRGDLRRMAAEFFERDYLEFLD